MRSTEHNRSDRVTFTEATWKWLIGLFGTLLATGVMGVATVTGAAYQVASDIQEMRVADRERFSKIETLLIETDRRLARLEAHIDGSKP